MQTVSVVIPCYNGASFLRETLDSVLAQTHRPLEVLVIDDGSTDNSAAIAESFGQPVRVMRQENQGESVARNWGIEQARGEWIAFVDADDIWHPTKLERQLEATGPDVVAVHTNVYYFGKVTGQSSIEDVPERERYSPAVLAVRNILDTPSSFLVRRSTCPRFPEWTRYAEDMVFFLELIQRGRMRLVESPLTGYRRHVASQASNPTAIIHWYETIETWLGTQNVLDCEESNIVRQAWVGRLCKRARSLKWRREWKDYWRMREYLERFAGNPEAEKVIRERIYPRWIYQLADVLPDRNAWRRTDSVVSTQS